MKELLFGAAYYLEYMPYDRVEEDLQMMKEAGMNVIRIAESTWSTMEPENGRFDFSMLDKMLDAAEKMEIMVIIGTPTYAIPSWLEKTDPGMLVTPGGQAQFYGRRQNMDITNPVYLQYGERMIRKLLEHTAAHPNVIGFQIDNETKYYGTDSKLVQQKFKLFLQEKYVTTEALNKAFYLAYWSNSIHSWDDLFDMRGCINGGLASEFDGFRRSLAAQFLVHQRSIVEEYRRQDQFITHNFDFEWKIIGAGIAPDGHSYGIQPDMDHSEAKHSVTIAGCDIYHPTQDHLTGAEIAFCGDEIRSLKQDNYLVLESQAQAFKSWTPYPGQLRLAAYSHLASGAASVMYWNWHSIHNGFEAYWKGVLSHDLAVNPTYKEAKQIGEEWKLLGNDTLMIRKKNKIAMVVNNASIDALKWFPVDREIGYNDIFRWMYDSLYRMNLECDIVHIRDLVPKDYKLILTPGFYSASEEQIRSLKDFVKEGGILVSSFRSFTANEHLSVYADEQPHGMTEVFGMSFSQFTEPGRTKTLGKKVRFFAELLQPDAGETLIRYEHPYWDAYSAVVKNQYYAGTAYYIGCFLDRELLQQLLKKIADNHLLREEPFEEVWPIIARCGINNKNENITYLLNYSEEAREVRCPMAKARELLSGSVYEKNDPIPLTDWGVAILKKGED